MGLICGILQKGRRAGHMKNFLLFFLLGMSQAWAQGHSNTPGVNALSTGTVSSGDSTPGPSSVPVKNFATRDLITTSRPMKISYFSLASARMVDIDRGGASVGSYNYLGASKKLDSESQVGLRVVFYHDTAGFRYNPAKAKEEYIGHTTTLGDPYLSYSSYSLAKWDQWNLSGSGRIYAPASRFSQISRLITQLRYELFLDRRLGKYSNFNYTVKTDYYVQTQRVYLDDEVPRYNDGALPSRAVRGTKIASLEHYVEFDANFHKKASFKPRIGFEENWYYDSKIEGIDARHDTDFKVQLGMEWRVMRRLSFTLAVENKTSLANRRDEVAFGRPDDNKWLLITYASF